MELSVIYMKLKVIQSDCGKKCGIKVEGTFRRINSTLWNLFESSLSSVDGRPTVELLWKLSTFHVVSIQWNLLDRPKCKIPKIWFVLI